MRNWKQYKLSPISPAQPHHNKSTAEVFPQQRPVQFRRAPRSLFKVDQTMSNMYGWTTSWVVSSVINVLLMCFFNCTFGTEVFVAKFTVVFIRNGLFAIITSMILSSFVMKIFTLFSSVTCTLLEISTLAKVSFSALHFDAYSLLNVFWADCVVPQLF